MSGKAIQLSSQRIVLKILNLNKWKGVRVIFSNFKTDGTELETELLMSDQASYVTLVPFLNSINISLLHTSALNINLFIFRIY